MLPPIRHTNRKEYNAATLDELIKNGYDIEAEIVLPKASVNISPIIYGQKHHPDFACIEHPPGWNIDQVSVPEVRLYRIKNSRIHGESGIVTVDNFFIRESLKLPAYEQFDIRWTGKDMLSIPEGSSDVEIVNGAHLFCGYPGTRNFSHFLFDILFSSFAIPPFDFYKGSTIITSPFHKKYQWEYLKYLPEISQNLVFLKGYNSVRCHSLLFSSLNATNQHHFPHPLHRELAQIIKERIISNKVKSGFPSKIYINRLDSEARKLMNEDEIISCVEAHGFTSISLSNFSIENQIELFAGASHIIAPHGAGETNVVYCAPETKLLELLCNNYVQWSMRRIGSLVPMEYGCIIGKEIGEAKQTWQRKWHLDVSDLANALKDFL